MWDKPESNHWVRHWKRKSKRILSMGALAQLMGYGMAAKQPSLLTPPWRPPLAEALSTSNYLLVPFSEEAGGIRRLKRHRLVCPCFSLIFSLPLWFHSSVEDYRREDCCHLHRNFAFVENPQSPEGRKQEGKTVREKVPCPLWVM